MFGGGAGQGASAKVTQTESGEVTEIGTGALVTLTSAQEIVELCLPGGSGYGDPSERAIEALGLDLRDEYVSVEGAAAEYCCSIDENGAIDVDKTNVLRQRNGRRRDVA
ncbi:MAG: hypothetical protein Ct9H300mP16_11170 [Pseudomonadota bacterium]|nr:MAG: hypothetical protein Ct9H300mP16_11170 [Pseudomonadota bacterium]